MTFAVSVETVLCRAANGLKTDIIIKLGSERRDFSGAKFYGDGKRNGDGDNVVETVKCYERESSNRYILMVTANGDVETSLNGSELFATSAGGCLKFWVARRQEKTPDHACHCIVKHRPMSICAT